MKRMICLFLLAMALSAYAAPVPEKRISLDLDQVRTEVFLRNVEQSSGYSLAYKDADIDLDALVTVHVKDERVSAVVTRALASQHVSAKVEGSRLVLSRSQAASAGKGTLVKFSGLVTDEQSQPVPFASVLIQGTTKGSMTDEEGRFSLEVPSGTRLIVSSIGYLDSDFTVTKENYAVIVLRTDVQQLEQVVVVGYGLQKKVNLTGAVAVRDMKEIENRPMSHASEALYSIPGVYVNQASSKPGRDGASIRVRGTGTIGTSTSPMVLVDGVEYSLDDVNPENIASISVLKDASASIYGSKAANGVILITTKTAGRGKTTVNLKANMGVQTPTRIPELVTDPIQFMQMRNQAELNSGKVVVTYSDDIIAEYQEGMQHDKYIYPATDWYKEVFTTGYFQQYDLSVSGDKQGVSYNIAGGYMNQKGIMVTSDKADRWSWDIKVGADVTKRLHVGASILGNVRHNTEPIYGVEDFMNCLNRCLPMHGTVLPDGRYLNTWVPTPGINSVGNPLMILNAGNIQRKIQRFIAKFSLRYSLPFGIVYEANLGYDKYDSFSKNFKLKMNTYNPKTYAVTAYSDYISVRDYDSNISNLSFWNTLNWNRTFASASTVGAMAGFEYKRYDTIAFDARKRGYFDDQLTALDAGSTMDVINGSETLQLLAGAFARVNYDYKQRYLVELVARYDGSSKFKEGNNWGFFPSLSVGWRIDQEGFMRQATWLDLLKLRGSIGQMGNQSIGNWKYLMSVKTAASYNYSFGNTLSAGAAISDFVDDAVTWETTTSYDAGLDVAAFGNRVVLGVDLYKKITHGILRTVTIPAQIGDLSGPMRNIGKVANDGFEVALTWRDSSGPFNWSVTGNVCYNKNIVVDIDNQEYKDSYTNIKEGYPVNAWWLYQADGYFADEAEIQSSPVIAGADIRPGYIRYKDINGDGRIDDDDRTYSGSSDPDFTYGLHLSFGWKGVELSAQFQGVQGIYTYLEGNAAAPFKNGAGVLKIWATDAWTPDHQDASLPILHTTTDAPYMYDYKNTQWLYDASYLRLKQLQLSWTLPQRWMSKAGISRVQVFANANNLFTLSPLKMFDPEISLTRTTLASYPTLKTYNFGFNLTF